MPKVARPVNPPTVAKAVGYSHAYETQGGRTLYLALFDALGARGYCNAYAGIALPNDASVALHRQVGFRPVGVFRSIGRKFGAWHDVSWWQRTLREDENDAVDPGWPIASQPPTRTSALR